MTVKENMEAARNEKKELIPILISYYGKKYSKADLEKKPLRRLRELFLKTK